MFEEGKRFSSRGIKLFFIPNGLSNNRVAFICARKYGTAVTRNYSRRLSREVYRFLKNRLRGNFDLILLVYPGDDTFERRMQQLVEVFSKAGLFLEME